VSFERGPPEEEDEEEEEEGVEEDLHPNSSSSTMLTEFTAISGTARGTREGRDGLNTSQTWGVGMWCNSNSTLKPLTSHHCPDGSDEVHHLHLYSWFVTEAPDALVHPPADWNSKIYQRSNLVCHCIQRPWLPKMIVITLHWIISEPASIS